jgi:hypothetical protein
MIRDVHLGSRIQIFSHPGSRIQESKKHRIPDPGVKKAPDPGSHIRNTAQKIIWSFALMFYLIDPMSLCSAVSVANKTIRLPINTANLTAFTVPQSSPDNRDQL